MSRGKKEEGEGGEEGEAGLSPRNDASISPHSALFPLLLTLYTVLCFLGRYGENEGVSYSFPRQLGVGGSLLDQAEKMGGKGANTHA